MVSLGLYRLPYLGKLRQRCYRYQLQAWGFVSLKAVKVSYVVIQAVVFG